MSPISVLRQPAPKLSTILTLALSAGLALCAGSVLAVRPPSSAQAKAGRAASANADAALWFREQRMAPAGRIPSDAHRAAAMTAMRNAAAAKRDVGAPVTWNPIGPGPIENVTMFGAGDLKSSGRALALAIHPANNSLLLLGAAQGGIWRSTDAGNSFVPVSDNLPSLAIKVIRFAPSDPSIVYAGSGEPHSKTSIFGMGVFKSTDAGATWTALPDHGPGWDFRFVAISGLRIDPSNPNTLHVTTANVLEDRVNPFQPPPSAPLGGIYKSTDGGQTWVLKQATTDYRPNAYPAHDPYTASGVGFMDLELFNANASVLFATEYSGGIWRSIDAGETWQLITALKNPGAGAASGPDLPAPVPYFSYFDTNTSLFTTYDLLRRPANVPEFNRIEIALGQAGAGITTDWHTAVIYAGVGAVLLLDANHNGTYEPDADIEASTAIVFKSTDGGQTWHWLGDWPNDGIPLYCDASFCGYEDALYDNVVEVNPADANDIILGGNCNYNTYWPDPPLSPVVMLQLPWPGIIFRSVDGGATWVDTTPGTTGYALDKATTPVQGLPVFKPVDKPSNKIIHPDAHSATYDWAGNRFYVTHDGGLSRCTVTGDGTHSFTDYSWEGVNNDLETLQFFHFSSHPTNPNLIQGGMQDNSSAAWNGTSWTAWDFDVSDGTVGAFDPLSPNIVYIGWQYALSRCDTGGSNNAANWVTLFDSAIGTDTSFPFVSLLAIDPVQPNNIYTVSTSAVYRSTNRGNDWLPRLNAGPLDGEPTAITVSAGNHNFVWVGTSTGNVYLFDVATGTILKKTGANMPNRWITQIRAFARETDSVVVTYSGYDANSADASSGGNGNVGRVYRTTDRGATWANISGNMTAANDLDTPVSALALDPANPQRIWIGTDTGVYETIDGGTTWQAFGSGLPVVAVMALEYNTVTGYLTAGTFGRSIWRTSISAPHPVPCIDLTGRVDDASVSVVCNTAPVPRCTLRFNFLAQNLCTQTAPPNHRVQVAFYLSADTALDDGDHPLGSRNFGVVAPNTALSRTISKRLPTSISAPGKYVIAVVDPRNTVPEDIDRANNTVVFGPIP